MKREYQKPTMMAVQLQHRTMLLSGSDKGVKSFGTGSSEGLNYRGSDANLSEEEAR